MNSGWGRHDSLVGEKGNTWIMIVEYVLHGRLRAATLDCSRSAMDANQTIRRLSDIASVCGWYEIEASRMFIIHKSPQSSVVQNHLSHAVGIFVGLHTVLPMDVGEFVLEAHLSASTQYQGRLADLPSAWITFDKIVKADGYRPLQAPFIELHQGIIETKRADDTIDVSLWLQVERKV